ncbi:MAG: hypothetical protein COX02_01865 [Candidatus Vogelbacteria bacterium CG22_combo_CG10-13_8_21_14_all_37_9]|uniref:Prepilin peptidase n=1 Tax=Candidatus Vogelbacteria bacterium CG22_combo_CG10-13_8_21_14_all_37_9 TaxID=1975046 RepID=A0A2H0BKG9_9BACT|nr:MAG: hypothetical protein BK005_00935 [bacterium CG10_37_50]PIP58131.1 MAG: hypothetical protein COX02_01865 [Candidatus Vogelbacteria bacterium CG22_combo_CG10-13_8_21_14_all_37_9]
MIWSTYILVIILGLIIGSFLNVLILRYHTGRSLGGRSGCLTCGQALCWFELIPVLSFICLKGHCRTCRTKISWQYPLVELLTAGLFVFSAQHFFPSWSTVVFSWLIISLLIVITVYDLRHKVIPDSLVYSFNSLALIWAIFLGDSLFVALLAGLIFFSAFWALWYFSHGTWMGFGDTKLVLGFGFLLGLSAGFSALLWAFVLGAIVGLLLLASSKLKKLPKNWPRFNLKTEVPFAPFLVIGLLLVWLANLNLLNVFLF